MDIQQIGCELDKLQKIDFIEQWRDRLYEPRWRIWAYSTAAGDERFDLTTDEVVHWIGRVREAIGGPVSIQINDGPVVTETDCPPMEPEKPFILNIDDPAYG